MDACKEPIENYDEINQIFKDDSIDLILQRLEKGNTEFCQKTIKQISGLSPLSMAVVFEQIKRGENMNLKEVFEMEYKIS